jgi:hypothetical protein
MTIRSIVLVAVLATAAAKAEEGCPWLNAATAGGVLGAAVRSEKVARPMANKEDATCTFLSPRGSFVHELRIQVETMPASRRDYASYGQPCSGSAEQLKAIGNEAAACTIDLKDGKVAEQVAGRVRDRAFVITISTNDGSATRNSLREGTRKVAEQVAGNLF